MADIVSNKINKGKNNSFKSLFWHLFSYIIVVAILFLINYFFSPDKWWFHLIMAGWGIGLLWHLLSVTTLKNLIKNFLNK